MGPHRNVGRAIVVSIAIVTFVYVAVALAVRGNLGLGEIAAARDFALAEAASPVFGALGFRLVAALAVVATVTSVMASMYSTSRMLGMMSDMDEVPPVDRATFGRRLPFGTPPLLVTTAVALVLTVAFDLTRIAALGALAYVSLDGVIHYGHLRHLRHETGAATAPLVAAIAVDVVVVAGLFAYRLRTDLVVIVAFARFALAVGGGETSYVRRVGGAGRAHHDRPDPGRS